MQIQLYEKDRPDVEMLATDGRMYIDGRWNHWSILRAIEERNARFAANFGPHKQAALKYKKLPKR